jgi:hypothetical protein
MRRFERVGGTLVEPIGHLWAAFSTANGETSLLNDESASILELLENQAASTQEICTVLASDSGLAIESFTALVEDSWPRLIEAGLVRELPHAGPQTE